MKPIQLEIKTYEELKEELGNEYDTAMYEINISALKEIERLNNIIKKTTKLLKQAGSYDEETKQFCDDVWEELPDILNVLEGSNK